MARPLIHSHAPMRLNLWASAATLALFALLALFATPAFAQTLIDDVRGTGFDEHGAPVPFTGLIISREGRVERVLRPKDKRPKNLDRTIDGKGRILLPGLVNSASEVMPLALAMLRAESAARNGGVEPAFPPPRPEDRDVAFGKLQRAMAARGITTLIDTGTTIEDWQTMRRAGDQGTLYLRIIGYAGSIADMALIAGPRPTPWLYDDKLRLIGFQLKLDAPRTSPSDDGTNAPDMPDAPAAPAYTETQLRNIMSRAAMSGFQPAIRVHDAETMRMALYAYEELALTYGDKRRWRIESSAPPAAEDIPALRAQKIALVLSPGSASWPDDAHLLAEEGLNAAFGINSGDGNTAMADRATGLSSLTIIAREMTNSPDGRLSTGAAQWLAGFSHYGAYAAFADERFGRLAPGQHADFIMLEINSSSGQNTKPQIVETWIGGRKIYDAALEATRKQSGPGQSLKGPEGEAAPVLPQGSDAQPD